MRGFAVVIACALLCGGCLAETSQGHKRPAHPCEKVYCKKGKMCEVNEDRSTTCVCPEQCPTTDPPAPVCTSYDMEFNSTCEMHKFACQVEILMTVKYKDRCEEGVGNRCPVGRLLQFHRRYLMFLMVAKAREDDPTFVYGDIQLDSLGDREREDIIKWEFKTRDLDKNGVLDSSEVGWMIEPEEGCMMGFLWSCDFDDKAGISRHEWEACFPPRIRVDTEDPQFVES